MALQTELPADVSAEAKHLHAHCECIDLHLDGFIWHRIFGYDLHKLHPKPPLWGHFGGHLDMPRAHRFGLHAGGWSITTNPFRSAQGRWRALQRNIEQFTAHLGANPARVEIARDAAAYRRLRQPFGETPQRDQWRDSGVHVVLPAIQGANALEAAPDGVHSIADRLITRITLVHLTNSCYGATSSPLAAARRDDGLTRRGKALVEQMNDARIFVDLAHINEAGFWDAVEVHDNTLPLIATHTGVDGVCHHWRNLDDRQLKAIANSGGVVGVIFQGSFLKRRGGPRDSNMVVEHLAHIVDVAGEDCAAIGSDYDGMISPPQGLRTPHYTVLVQRMLERGWSAERIRKILGGNFLRAFTALRPGAPSTGAT